MLYVFLAGILTGIILTFAVSTIFGLWMAWRFFERS